MDIFESLEKDMESWLYSLELWFCPGCPQTEYVDYKGATHAREVWHVQAVGQNTWNDEPWEVQYSFSTQQEAYHKMQELGRQWIEA